MVDEVVSVEGLGDPERVGELGAEAGAIERGQDALDAVLAQEEIEILRIAPDAGVLAQGVGATDHGLEPLLLQHAQREPVRVALLAACGAQTLRRRLHGEQLGDGTQGRQTCAPAGPQGERRSERPPEAARVRRRVWQEGQK